VDAFAAAVLGLVQALTEFLPVSSSGHLVLGQTLMGVQTPGAAFEVAVHVGTLLSVVVVLREDVLRLLRAALRPGWRGRWEGRDTDLRLVAAILIGCVPAGLVGLLYKDELEALFDAPTLVCGALLGTGVVLLATRWAPDGDGEVSLLRAIGIGIAQAVAIIPGVSRSGATIAVGMFLGVERDRAARYSFLLSLPVISGAALLQARDLLRAPPEGGLWLALTIGTAVSFVAGIGALKLLLGVVRRGWFPHFGWYCLTVGFAGLVWL